MSFNPDNLPILDLSKPTAVRLRNMAGQVDGVECVAFVTEVNWAECKDPPAMLPHDGDPELCKYMSKHRQKWLTVLITATSSGEYREIKP